MQFNGFYVCVKLSPQSKYRIFSIILKRFLWLLCSFFSTVVPALHPSAFCPYGFVCVFWSFIKTCLPLCWMTAGRCSGVCWNFPMGCNSGCGDTHAIRILGRSLLRGPGWSWNYMVGKELGIRSKSRKTVECLLMIIESYVCPAIKGTYTNNFWNLRRQRHNLGYLIF